MTNPTGGALLIVLLYASLATALGHVDYHIRAHPERGFAEYSPGVVAGTEGPPGRYRVLGPYLYEGVARVTGLEPGASWIVFRWLCLVAAFAATHLLCATWFPRGPTVAGVLLTAGLLPLTFTNSWAHPDHLVELALFTAATAASVRGRTAWFAIALVATALNRETSVFLLPLFALSQPLTRRHLMATAAMGALWAAVYVGLRWALGFETYDPWQIRQNLTYLTFSWNAEGRDLYYRGFAWFVVVLSVPLVWAAASGWRELPRAARASVAVAAPLLVVTGLLFSSVIETRIFTPLLPLLVPAALFGLFPSDSRRRTG